MWFSLTVPTISYNSLGNKKTNKDYEWMGNIFLHKTNKILKRCLFLRLSLHKYTQQFGKDIFITENFSLGKKKPCKHLPVQFR